MQQIFLGKLIVLQATFLFSILFFENGLIPTEKLKNMLEAGITSNGVIFDSEEIQGMVYVLMEEYQNSANYDMLLR